MRRPSTVERHERRDLAMLAVQGPEARAKAAQLLTPRRCARGARAWRAFFGAQLGAWFVARTGYTGEDGFEIMLPADGAVPAVAQPQRARRRSPADSARATRCGSRPA